MRLCPFLWGYGLLTVPGRGRCQFVQWYIASPRLPELQEIMSHIRSRKSVGRTQEGKVKSDGWLVGRRSVWQGQVTEGSEGCVRACKIQYVNGQPSKNRNVCEERIKGEMETINS